MRRGAIIISMVVSAAAAGWFAGASRAARAGEERPAPLDTRVFEIRTYTTHPGKLAALHARFRDHTCMLFAKHGIKNIAYWTPADGPEAENTLIYAVAHDSREAAAKSWAAFRDDPEWKKVYADSHKDGPIVAKVESKYLRAVDYSPIR